MSAPLVPAVQEVQFGPLAARVYGCGAASPAALVLHLHGGTFNTGSIESGRCVAEALREAGAAVASIAYPLAPRHRFPETLEDIYRSLQALHAKRRAWSGRMTPLHVAGEEAGGNLAAALAMMARDRGGPRLAGQILFSPMLDACLATHSLRTADAGPVGCRWADGWHDYLGSPDRAAHPYAAPLGAMRLSGLPPALIVTAEDDPLRDECAAYAGKLRKAGVQAELHVERGPTDWPGAYSAAETEPCCLESVHDPLVSFFRSTAPP